MEQVNDRLQPLQMWDVAAIHAAAVQILSQTGMHFESPAVQTLMRQHGFKTDGPIVFFGEDHIQRALETAGRAFTLLARNPERNVVFDRDTCGVGTGRGAVFMMEPDGTRRNATAADCTNIFKLAHNLDVITILGNLVIPGDIPPSQLYPFLLAAQLLYSDKPVIALDATSIELLCAAFDTTPQAMQTDAERGLAYAHATINAISPLMLSRDQGDSLLRLAEHGIAICISPTPAAGSTGPCTLAGTLTLQHSEFLGLLVVTQLVRPGLPVFYSTFPASSDMRTMGVAYGSPEARVMEVGAAQIAKSFDLLTRGNIGLTDSQISDFQAGAEAMFNVTSAIRAKINYLPGCGHLASFAAASCEKLVLDAELANYVLRYCQPIPVNAETLAVEVIQAVGPRGNFVTQKHTFDHFRTEFYHPSVFCRQTYERWARECHTAALAAREAVHRILERYAPPPIDPDLERRLRRIVAG
ncbi:MAG: trimethylamine methyltransferase family protein [Desulfosarcinaceae bacterium]|nr:trimethylamine methyltransferase family protein [Desulfosarcinaceae bacterium]